MFMRRWSMTRLSVTLAVGLLYVACGAHAADENTRFYGTWITQFSYNGQMVTMVSRGIQ